jgi:hypothetical protein
MHGFVTSRGKFVSKKKKKSIAFAIQRYRKSRRAKLCEKKKTYFLSTKYYFSFLFHVMW